MPQDPSPWSNRPRPSTNPLNVNKSRTGPPSSNGSGSVPPKRPQRSNQRPMSGDLSQVPVAAWMLKPRRGSQASFESISSEDDEPSMPPPKPKPKEVPVQPPPVPKAMSTVLAALNDAGQRSRSGSKASLPSGSQQKRPRKETIGEQGGVARLKPRIHALPTTPAFREIERVIQQVEQEWPVLLPLEAPQDGTPKPPDFAPVQLALALIDMESKDGRNSRLQSFLRLKDSLNRALKSHIQQHYRAFDASISAYNSTLANLGSAQKEVVQLRSHLMDIREVLSTRRSELVSMVARRDELSEMSKILDSIDNLKDVPDTLESLLSEKSFLKAVVLLSKSLKTINKSEMMEIGAISDLRAYLQSQEQSIFDILIEELHNHLYLKSYYSESRWEPYTKGQTSLPSIDATLDDDLPAQSTSQATNLSQSTSRKSSALHRFLQHLAAKPSLDPQMTDEYRTTPVEAEPSSPTAPVPPSPMPNGSTPNAATLAQRTNPEMKPFTYIETLFESFACLNKTSEALDIISQRLPVEIYNLVEATIEEVDERNPQQAFRTGPRVNAVLGKRGSGMPLASQLGSIKSALSRANSEGKDEILRDLFWSLFSKLDAVMQGFRVAYEVCVRISERRAFRYNSDSQSGNNLILSLVEIWKPLQAEIRSLLREYLIEDEESGLTARNPIASINEVLGSNRSPRNTSKPMYYFADSDAKASFQILKPFEEDLNVSLKNAVPGLVQTNVESVTALSNVITAEERLGDDHIEVKGIHRLLVPPDAFHISVLFGPTLSFLDHMQEVLPTNITGEEERGFSAFLEDFVASSYLPLLEEKVTNLFQQATTSPDAFLEDRSLRRKGPPVIKCTASVLNLIRNLCKTLHSSPFHSESYSRLIIGVVESFWARCGDRYRELVARHYSDAPDAGPLHATDEMLKTAAVWSKHEGLLQLFSRLRIEQPTDDPELGSDLLFKELEYNFEYKGGRTIHEDELLYTPKKWQSLATLYTSLDYFIDQVEQLRDASNSGADYLHTNSDLALPLTDSMAQQFSGTVAQLKETADMVLLTLRNEIRLRAFHHLDGMAQQGLYDLPQPSQDPDDFVVVLNSEVSQFDEAIATQLAPRDRNAILLGLPTLLDQLLLTGARQLQSINANGADKMCRNAIALQQNLFLLGEIPLQVNLNRSRSYYDLLRTQDPQALVQHARSGGASAFRLEDLRVLLALMCHVTRDGTQTLKQDEDNRGLYRATLQELEAVMAEDT